VFHGTTMPPFLPAGRSRRMAQAPPEAFHPPAAPSTRPPAQRPAPRRPSPCLPPKPAHDLMATADRDGRRRGGWRAEDGAELVRKSVHDLTAALGEDDALAAVIFDVTFQRDPALALEFAQTGKHGHGRAEAGLANDVGDEKVFPGWIASPLRGTGRNAPKDRDHRGRTHLPTL